MILIAIVTTAQDSLNNIAQIRNVVNDLISLRESITHDTNLIHGIPDALTSALATALVAAFIRFLEKSIDKIINKKA